MGQRPATKLEIRKIDNIICSMSFFLRDNRKAQLGHQAIQLQRLLCSESRESRPAQCNFGPGKIC